MMTPFETPRFIADAARIYCEGPPVAHMRDPLQYVLSDKNARLGAGKG